MSEEIEGGDDMQTLFTNILGSEVTIKDNIDSVEEKIFITFIKKIEDSQLVENKLFEEGGVELSRVTDPLWFVIENSFKFIYGEKATDLILWYVYDRFSPDGEIIELEDEGGKTYILKTPKDLWSYIQYQFPQDNPE
tara:strand:+ start:121 stop:531 length:411 start_codon:yes stop_codon:yes gene_type:complete